MPSLFRSRFGKRSPPVDAHSYLSQISKSSPYLVDRGVVEGTDTSSLLSYETTASLRNATADYSFEDEEELQEEREKGWRGLNIPMPIPSHLQAHLQPTRSFDDDFTPFPSDPYSLRHSEYGYDVNPEHRSLSQYQEGTSLEAKYEEPSLFIYLATYFSYGMLILIGHMRDFFGKWLTPTRYSYLQPSNGYAPLFSDFDSFYTRRLKLRIEDCFARPITFVAGRTATLLDRTSHHNNKAFTFTGETTQALNISSYNYLGFAQSRGACAEMAELAVREYGVSPAGSRQDVGTNDLHVKAERLMANFLGTEDCMIISTGFATNSTTLPALVSKGCLIIADELNHSSIRFGSRLSGAMVRPYKHNDMVDLENLLRECISQGQPRSHRPWKKILVAVEGLYSMEGTILDLPRMMELKETYKFYLFIDEAHSIGALGPHGRGVAEYFGVDPKRIDILMGTFTKSFGAAGGYIAGSHGLISSLRQSSHSDLYSESMSAPVAMQIITSTGSIMGPSSISFVPSLASLPLRLMDGRDGEERLRRLTFNCRYLSTGFKKLGFIVYGHHDSPIVPLLVFNPGKLGQFSRLMLERWKIVVVLAAYPACSLVTSRIRFCVSAAHTKADLDRILVATDDIGTTLGLKLSRGKRMRIEDVVEGGVEAVRRIERGE